MKKIESTGEISLIDLFRLVIKNIFSIIYFTVVGLILGLIYVNTMMTPQYTATGTVAMKVSTNTTVLNTITEVATSTSVAELALLSLEEDNVVLASGEDITVDYIRSGVTASYLATSLNVTVKFVSEEEASSVEILNAVLDATVSFANTNYSVINNNLILGAYAASAVYSGQSKTVILVIAVLLGGILGVGIGLLTDMLGGKILFSSDVCQLGVPYFHFVTSKNSSDEVLKTNIIKLQNNIESKLIGKQLKIIGFVSTDSNLDVNEIIKNMGIEYASNNLKTLIIDLDLETPSLHQTFHVANDIHVSGVVENKYYQKPIYKKVAENIFLLPAKQHVYPSRIIKHINFEKMLESIKADYDCVLIKLSPSQTNDSSFISVSFLDSLVINVQVNQTKKTTLISYVNEIYNCGFENVFVNVLESKKVFLANIPFINKIHKNRNGK